MVNQVTSTNVDIYAGANGVHEFLKNADLAFVEMLERGDASTQLANLVGFLADLGPQINAHSYKDGRDVGSGDSPNLVINVRSQPWQSVPDTTKRISHRVSTEVYVSATHNDRDIAAPLVVDAIGIVSAILELAHEGAANNTAWTDHFANDNDPLLPQASRLSFQPQDEEDLVSATLVFQWTHTATAAV